jgi:uracil-DNA glycosylase
MPPDKSETLAALAWLLDAGADEALQDVPIDRFMVAAPKVAAPKVTAPQALRPAPEAIRPKPEFAKHANAPIAPPAGDTDSIGRATEIAARCNSLGELRAALEAFDGSALKKLATNTVFADGTPDYRIMLIGEAPGREEDLAGLPFVGRAGKLLDKMLAAIGLDRKKNAYITNVINWRPPENRDPSPEEAAICLPFLRRHIELVDPEIIIVLGAVAARHVMGRTDGIMRLRGKWLEYFANGRLVPVMPTLHPAYLLRRAIDKKLAWRDLQAIDEKIKSLGLLERAAARG